MSEDQAASTEGPAKKKGPGILILGGIILVVVAIAALLVYTFFLKPRLEVDPDTNGDTGLIGETPGTPDHISAEVVAVDFDEALVNVKMPEGSDLPASLLTFQISLECNNPATSELVTKHMARFTDLVNAEHEFKTRAELDNPRTKSSMAKAILLKANSLLRRLQPPDDINPEIKINEVLYLKFMIVDNM